jgi:hypothetical protein
VAEERVGARSPHSIATRVGNVGFLGRTARGHVAQFGPIILLSPAEAVKKQKCEVRSLVLTL